VTIGHVSDPCCPVLTAGEEVVLVCPREGQVSQLITLIPFIIPTELMGGQEIEGISANGDGRLYWINVIQ